jgi:hypothetical protein
MMGGGMPSGMCPMMGNGGGMKMAEAMRLMHEAGAQ